MHISRQITSAALLLAATDARTQYSAHRMLLSRCDFARVLGMLGGNTNAFDFGQVTREATLYSDGGASIKCGGQPQSGARGHAVHRVPPQSAVHLTIAVLNANRAIKPTLMLRRFFQAPSLWWPIKVLQGAAYG